MVGLPKLQLKILQCQQVAMHKYETSLLKRAKFTLVSYVFILQKQCFHSD